MASTQRGGGGNKRKDGNIPGAGGSIRGRGAWGRGAPHMNQPYAPSMSPNIHSPRPMGPGMNGHPSFSNIAQTIPLPNSPVRPDKAQQDRALSTMGEQLGTKIFVNLTNGQRFEGVLVHFKSESQFTLEDVKDHNAMGAPMRPKLQIQNRDLLDWRLVEATAAKPGTSSFRTDADISAQTAPARERELAGPGAWANDTSAGLPPLPSFPASPSYAKTSNGQPPADDVTFGAGTSSGWDQFAANEKLFGVTTTFDEELYTTKLDRSASDFKERERRAQQLAAEIQGSTTSNPHLAEERGAAPDDSGVNEEDKYGAVVRNPNVYVPPAARRAAAAAAAANGTTPAASTAGPTDATDTTSSKPSMSSPASVTPATLQLETSEISAVPTVTVDLVDELPANQTEDIESKPHLKEDPSREVKPEDKATGVESGLDSPTPSKTTNTASDDKSGASTEKVASNLMNDFRNFVAGEKERITTQRKNAVKVEKDKRIADLIRFSANFKLNKEVPEDLVEIMTKDEEKRRAILEKSKTDAKSTGARAIGTGVIPASTSTRFNNAINLAQVANAVKSPMANAVPPSSTSSGSTISGKPAKLGEKYTVPIIPPFNPNKHKAVASVAASSASTSPAARPSSDVDGKKAPAEAPTSPAKSPPNDFKLNINASSFKPNANAPTFKPVNGVSPAATPSRPTAAPVKKAEEPASAQPQPNAFFGSAVLKKGSVHIKDDFSPFKHNKVAEAPGTASTWPYTGKRYNTLFPPQPTPPPPQPMPTAYEEETQQTQALHAQAAYINQMYQGYAYRYPGQPGHPPMPMPGNPNGYMPPQFMQMAYAPAMHGAPPPTMYPHPMMSPMAPPGAQFMQSPMPGPPPQFPGPPNSNGAGRGSMPPTPLPPHAYAQYQTPPMAHGVPYQMMMPGPPNGPAMSFDASGQPVQMGPPH